MADNPSVDPTAGGLPPGIQISTGGSGFSQDQIDQLKATLAGAGDPGKKLMVAMYLLLPAVMGQREEKMHAMAELLNNLSVMSNTVSSLQNEFNDAHTTPDSGAIAKTVGEMKALVDWMKSQGDVFDSSVTDAMDKALGQVMDGVTDPSQLGAHWQQMWADADNSTDDSSASLKIKGVLDGFSSMSQTTSSMSNRTQAEVSFASEEYKQLLATFKSLLSDMKDEKQSFVDGLKRQS